MVSNEFTFFMLAFIGNWTSKLKQQLINAQVYSNSTISIQRKLRVTFPAFPGSLSQEHTLTPISTWADYFQAGCIYHYIIGDVYELYTHLDQ